MRILVHVRHYFVPWDPWSPLTADADRRAIMYWIAGHKNSGYQGTLHEISSGSLKKLSTRH